MDGHRDDRQMEVVKHDVNVLVDAPLEAKVQMKYAAAYILQTSWVFWSEGIQLQIQDFSCDFSCSRDAVILFIQHCCTPTYNRHL